LEGTTEPAALLVWSGPVVRSIIRDRGKGEQAHFAATNLRLVPALRVLRTKGACLLFPDSRAMVTRLTKEPTMSKSAGCSLLALLAMGIAGCKSVAPPDVLHPGPAAAQQGRAQQYDPYPQAEAGGNIAGTRPPDYQQPVPEVDRARWMLSGNGRACPPPGPPVAGYGSPAGAPGGPVVTQGTPVAPPGMAPVATGPAFSGPP
jgi:hypothetical protein